MTDYTVTTNFGAKDSLPTGNAAKVIKGSEFSTEFNNIALGIDSKSNTAGPTFTGTVTIPVADITTSTTVTDTITTANITTANITNANCVDLTVEEATDNGTTSATIRNTGTGDADAAIKIDSSASGESEVRFLHEGTLGASVSWFTDGSPDLNIATTGDPDSVIDLQPDGTQVFRAEKDLIDISVATKIEYANNSNPVELLIHNTGTGDADAVLKLDAGATGESDIEFLHEGVKGAAISWLVDGETANPDFNIITYVADSVIDLQPNNVNTVSVKENICTVTGQLNISDGTIRGKLDTVGADVYLADSVAGLRVSGGGTNNIFACDDEGAITNGVTDLGAASGRFNKIFGTGLDCEIAGTAKVNLKGTGTGEADANLTLDSSDVGESIIQFKHDGVTGANIEWYTEGTPDLNITTVSGSGGVIDLQPNTVRTLRATENGLEVKGLLEVGSSTTMKGKIAQKSGSDDIYIADAITGLRLSGAGTNNIFSCDSNGLGTTEVTDLGASGHRWKTIYSLNALNTSSDRNMKQSIEELSEAEVRVAQVCKGLVRKFKWNSSVERKGVESARYHVGVMAQDLESAFEAEGLNAEDYGMFERSEQDGSLSVRYTELLAFIIGGL